MAVMVSLKGSNPLLYSLNRIFDTFIGIIVAVIVNYLVFPPDYLPKIHRTISHLSFKAEQIIKDLILKKKINLVDYEQELGEVNALCKRSSEDENIPLPRRKPKKNASIFEVQKKLSNFNQILLHLRIINQLPQTFNLSPSNIEEINNTWNCNIPSVQPFLETETDIIFNYHVQRILSLYRDIYDLSTLMPSEG